MSVPRVIADWVVETLGNSAAINAIRQASFWSYDDNDQKLSGDVPDSEVSVEIAGNAGASAQEKPIAIGGSATGLGVAISPTIDAFVGGGPASADGPGFATGFDSVSSGSDAVAFAGATVTGDNSWGFQGDVAPDNAILFSDSASSISTGATGSVAVGIGADVTDGSSDTVLVGSGTTVGQNSPGALAIGRDASVGQNTDGAITVGRNSFAGDNSVTCIAVGSNATVKNDAGRAVAIGNSTKVGNNSPDAGAIGADAEINGNSDRSHAFGNAASVGANSKDCYAIGTLASIPADVDSNRNIGGVVSIGSSASPAVEVNGSIFSPPRRTSDPAPGDLSNDYPDGGPIWYRTDLDEYRSYQNGQIVPLSADPVAEAQDVLEGRESGTVTNGNQGVLVVDNLANGDAAEIYKAGLTLADGQPAPTDLDLELVTMDNAGAFTSRVTLLSGDGTTVFDRETGDPLASWTNSTGSAQTIALIVDNGTGSDQDIAADAEGVTGV
jgi:hypothetical protein